MATFPNQFLQLSRSTLTWLTFPLLQDGVWPHETSYKATLVKEFPTSQVIGRSVACFVINNAVIMWIVDIEDFKFRKVGRSQTHFRECTPSHREHVCYLWDSSNKSYTHFHMTTVHLQIIARPWKFSVNVCYQYYHA